MILHAATPGNEEDLEFSGALYVLLSLRKSLRSNNVRSRIAVMVVALLAAALPIQQLAQRGQGGGSQAAQGGQARGGGRPGAQLPLQLPTARRCVRHFGNEQAAPSVPFSRMETMSAMPEQRGRAKDNQISRTEGHPYNPHDLTEPGVGTAFGGIQDGKGLRLQPRRKEAVRRAPSVKSLSTGSLFTRKTIRSREHCQGQL
jgi:hypothetical protein